MPPYACCVGWHVYTLINGGTKRVQQIRKHRCAFSTDDLTKVKGDLRLLAWYAILKSYSGRFKKDKDGFTRISSEIFLTDWQMERISVWRYNKSLEELGLIIVDKKHRGGRTWMGYKII